LESGDSRLKEAPEVVGAGTLVQRAGALAEQAPDGRHAMGCDRITILETVRELFKQLPDRENFAPTDRHCGIEDGTRLLGFVKHLADVA
jgi:hypothetical protein